MNTSDRLIDAVYRRTALWDPKHIGHHNRFLINKLWQEVADEIGIDKIQAKSKWRGLRDYYRQEVKKQANYITDSGMAEYRSSWALFDQMSFIKDTILPRKQRDLNLGNSGFDMEHGAELYDEDPINICIPKLEPQFDLPEFLPEQAQETQSSSDCHDPEKAHLVSRRNLHKLMNNRFKPEVDNDLEVKKRRIAYYERSLEESGNDDLHFFKSLLPDLANLPRAKKSYIRLKIQEIIHKEIHNNEGLEKSDKPPEMNN